MALRGGLAKLISQAGNSVLRLGFMIVAARLLEPKDFGLVAMVTVFTAVLDLFSTAGLSSAAVQKSTINNEQISTLFWINILVGVMLSILCVLIAPLIVAFYHEPRLFWVTVAMGAGFLFNAAGVQHLALLQRQMRYVTPGGNRIFMSADKSWPRLCLALAGYGYWALVAAAIALPAAMTVSTWMATGWIPGRPSWNAGIRSMLHFGGTLTLNGVISYLTYNFDKFIVGRVWGATALGYYGVASQLINTPKIQSQYGDRRSDIFCVVAPPERCRPLQELLSEGLLVEHLNDSSHHDFLGRVRPRHHFGCPWTEVGRCSGRLSLLAPAVLFFGIINPLVWILLCQPTTRSELEACARDCRPGPDRMPCWLTLRSERRCGRVFDGDGALAHSAYHVVSARDTITPLDLFRTISRPLVSAVVAVALAYAVCAYCGPLKRRFPDLFSQAVS